MNEAKESKKIPKEKLGVAPYVIAWLGIFLPYIGVLFSTIAFIWGVVSQKKGARSLWLLGFAGLMLFTLLSVLPFYSIYSLFSDNVVSSQSSYYYNSQHLYHQPSNVMIIEDNSSNIQF
jgi:hypothetical protein